MSVPLPLRIVAGVAATVVDQVRRLPEELPGAAVSLAGAAMRTSLRVRQELAELATRGDELLAPLLSQPEENPPWAHFDDDDAGSSDADSSAAGSSDAGSSAANVHVVVDAQTPGPVVMPDYDTLRLAQLRERLTDLDADAVADLLSHEESGRARAAFVTTLRNRLATLEAAS